MLYFLIPIAFFLRFHSPSAGWHAPDLLPLVLLLAGQKRVSFLPILLATIFFDGFAVYVQGAMPACFTWSYGMHLPAFALVWWVGRSSSSCPLWLACVAWSISDQLLAWSYYTMLATPLSPLFFLATLIPPLAKQLVVLSALYMFEQRLHHKALELS